MLLPTICTLTLLPVSVVATPQLQVTPESYELGRQARNTGQYPLIFKLKNIGDQPLKIESVRGGCACLSVALPKRELAPNEKLDLTATFNSIGYEGHVQKAVFLTSNDATSRARVLSFHVFLPYSSTGLRFKPHCYRIPVATVGEVAPIGRLTCPGGGASAGTADGAFILKAAPVVENCNAAGTITLTGVKLPDGWRCATPFPVAVKAESTAEFQFIRDAGPPLPPNAKLLFTFTTDFPRQPEFKAVLVPAKPQPPSGSQVQTVLHHLCYRRIRRKNYTKPHKKAFQPHESEVRTPTGNTSAAGRAQPGLY